MDNKPKGGTGPALILAHVVCCGGILLFVTGILTLNAIGAWLLDGGLIWLGAGGIAIAVLLLWRRWRRRGAVSDRSARRMDAERAQ
jgi:membrane protein implicated in regulation of membrane protease activity